MVTDEREKPTFEEYSEWYHEEFADDLRGGKAQQWYERATMNVREAWERSSFWKQLLKRMVSWDVHFKIEHDDYSLFSNLPRDIEIHVKPFESVLNKSFRWNIRDNGKFRDPPPRMKRYIAYPDVPDRHDPGLWFGPQNWLSTFSDIIRTRFVTTYFDGVRYLADRIVELATDTTSSPPALQLRASQYGYFAAHIGVYHELKILDYDHSDPISIRIPMEILHVVYDNWRTTGPPRDWEWNHRDPAFSINYLGSTLHYLEGMIVMARDARRSS